MNFSFLDEINDSTLDLQSVKRKCERALHKNNPDDSILEYEKALEKMVKWVYKREGLPSPKNRNKSNSEPVFADYICESSPFGIWLGKDKESKNILEKCHEIRRIRNSSAHESNSLLFEARWEEVKKVEKYIESIFRSIVSNISREIIRKPRDKHLACVMLLDISHSMRDPGVSREGERPIDYLNRAIISFKNQIVASRDINASVEISFITFNDKVEVIQPFRNADRFNIPALIAYGNKTAMNEAIEKALDIIEIQKKLYRDEDIEYYRPYLFLFSDGIPTDKDREEIAKSRIKEAILGKHVIYCPVAIGDNADVDVLCSYFPDSVKKMVIQAKKGQLDIVFEYLSDSISESVLNDGYVDTSDLGLARGLKIIKR